MPSVKTAAAKGGLKTADGRVSLDANRLVFDFDRDTISVIWQVNVTGLAGFTERESVFKVSELQKAQSKDLKAILKWFLDQAVARGDIPAGTVSV